MAGTLNTTTVNVTTLSGVSTLTAASGVLATQNGMTGIAKAWVNYQGGNGNTSGTINSSFNVSSITANSTGNWTVNITTAMPNATYVVQTSVNNSSSPGQNAIAYYGAKTTSTIVVYCVTGSGGAALTAVDVSVAVLSS